MIFSVRFNEFIERIELLYVPIVGRNTWYKVNDMTKSKIDKVLISIEWFEKWPECK